MNKFLKNFLVTLQIFNVRRIINLFFCVNVSQKFMLVTNYKVTKCHFIIRCLIIGWFNFYGNLQITHLSFCQSIGKCLSYLNLSNGQICKYYDLNFLLNHSSKFFLTNAHSTQNICPFVFLHCLTSSLLMHFI